MCVPNLVPIGPQTAMYIRLEGYTHRHTLSYIDIDSTQYFFNFELYVIQLLVAIKSYSINKNRSQKQEYQPERQRNFF